MLVFLIMLLHWSHLTMHTSVLPIHVNVMSLEHLDGNLAQTVTLTEG